jgi:hypothetical protein
MATLQEQLNQIGTDADKLHQILHGNAATDVPTDGGTVPTVRKLFSDISEREAANVAEAKVAAQDAVMACDEFATAAGVAKASAEAAAGEINDLRTNLLAPPRQLAGVLAESATTIDLGVTGFVPSGVTLFLGGSLQTYGTDFTVDPATGLVTLATASGFSVAWAALIWPYVIGVYSGGGEAGVVTWDSVTGKPAAFPPAAHNHEIDGVTGLAAALDAKASAADVNTALSNLAATIPDALSEMSEDTTHRTVTDAEKAAWSGKQDALAATQKLRIVASTSAPSGTDWEVWFQHEA